MLTVGGAIGSGAASACGGARRACQCTGNDRHPGQSRLPSHKRQRRCVLSGGTRHYARGHPCYIRQQKNSGTENTCSNALRRDYSKSLAKACKSQKDTARARKSEHCGLCRLCGSVYGAFVAVEAINLTSFAQSDNLKIDSIARAAGQTHLPSLFLRTAEY